MMIKALAPMGLAMALGAIGPAEAARCPSGQIYRVSLGVCAPKTSNMQFYHSTGAGHARPAPASEARSAQPARATTRPPESGETIIAAQPPATSEPAPFSPPAIPSPFGALPSVLSFK